MGPRHGAGDPGGVDLYVGGVEHAVLHLLYSRFWHKVLYDLGYLSSEEPYRRLYNQGYIQAYAYTDARGVYVPAEEVVETTRDGVTTATWKGQEVGREYGKMGKSLRNSVSPDEMCDTYGADTLRLYEMSMGPLDASRPWATRDVVGAHRFLQRVWRNVVDETTGTPRVGEQELDQDTLRMLHRTIAGVREDFAALRFNTGAAKLTELNNHVTKHFGAAPVTPRAVAEPLVQMLAPLCPHVAEELWSRMGHHESLTTGPFPEADPRHLVATTVEYPIQVNGRLRSRMLVAAEASTEELEAAALADRKIAAAVGDGAPRKVIVVPGRLVNVVL